MMKTITLIMTIALIISTTCANAYMFDGIDVDIEYWAGSGVNEAICVVDFGTSQYAFGYNFDGTSTGFDMIQTIADEGALDIVTNDFGFGLFVDGIMYDGNSEIGYGGGENWWHYWTSEDGSTWISSAVGAADRTLADGQWDGWGYGFVDAPDVSTVPEPGTLAALGMGVTGLAGFVIRKRS